MWKKYFWVAVLLCALISQPVAAAVQPPNPKVEAVAAKVLFDLGIKLHKLNLENPKAARKQGMHAHDLKVISLSLARLGRDKTALQVAEWAKATGTTQPRNRVLLLLIRRSASFGKFKEANEFVSRITDDGWRAIALLAIAHAYVQTKDFGSSQKVLFQVTPLTPTNFDVVSYTAVLFAKINHINVARRLFGRAKKMIDEAGRTGSQNAASRRFRFQKYLIQAGLIHDWMKYREEVPVKRPGLLLIALPKLWQQKQIDLFQKVAMTDDSMGAAATYPCMLSLFLYPHDKQKALALLEKATENYKTLPQRYEQIKAERDNFDDAGLGNFMALSARMISNTNLLLGRETDAKKWLQKAANTSIEYKTNKMSKSEKIEKMKIHFLLLLLIIKDGMMGKKSTFTPIQLLRMHKAVYGYLIKNCVSLDDTRNLRFLILAQIKSGQTKQAHENILFLDKLVRTVLNTNEGFIPGKAVDIAKLWKTSGDPQRCYILLQQVFEKPAEWWHTSKIYFLNICVDNGLAEEALKLFEQLPKKGLGNPQDYFELLPEELAKSRPDTFPAKLLASKDQHKYTENLNGYTKSFTGNIFLDDFDQVIFDLRKSVIPGA